ncbi:four-carbon acid sugar kinase family protein [Paracoccus pantotrophus]|uniref:3-oxo-tetronate kinase n=1 Tax=Paracoccus pantotrophus TaxID=82367 RepID=A0A7H9BT48_PARPN|nr:3-oxo-tetronate kinase [Paracoccus pantotrophus]QLH13031.1 four-carbon acid sugar kinase family protein [Paracoccus pantotrophus]
MTTFFGAIADDLTGATDLAGLLARSGVAVSLRMGVPSAPPQTTAPVEIIALKCRTAPVDEAVAGTRSALDWLRRAGAQRFFWKYCSTFDSTPRGNIGPVAEALMRDLGAGQTIYCPAFPENGRSIFMGNLFVGEQPLAESPMKDHPLTPMRDSNLIRLLEPQVGSAVGLANRLCVARGPEALRARLAELKAQGVAHVIVDAVANDDLHVIAEACRDLPLMTGGSAVAMPLPKLWLEQGLLPEASGNRGRDMARGPAIVLSGSCSAMTNAQVAAFIAQGHPALQLDPLDLAGNGAGAALGWLSRQPGDAVPIIYATARPESVRAAQDRLGRERAGEIVEEALAACAVAARDQGRRQFVVAGGETSGAVGRALEIERLDVGREIAPGVPWCFAESGGHPIAITLKSGNFGAESFFEDALGMLDP